ncbi:hypothetical protein [Bosea sp. ANAM02]|uniref:hypothetical protein n=1 Tax=Bosea sp. ANAM02 TaxID=2020412 RepID=UPI00140EC743|nr:hypothetical protein [Bosea sp. ANAM02]BCB17932.1 hypothetical protein OCUBac02_08260 [Bosea sp. ANAM02]
MLNTTRISVRAPVELVKSVDHLVFARRIPKAPGRSATRSAVIVDLLKRGLALVNGGAPEQKDTH